jgi:hypothetical protein
VEPQADRWEVGGEFEWPDLPKQVEDSAVPSDAVTFGSGRDAMRAVLEHGARAHGWDRCLVPYYYCGDVIPAIKASGLRIAWYDDLPTRPSLLRVPDLSERDVVLRCNYFGLRGPAAGRAVASSMTYSIEDHTHDPWGEWCRTSRAHYCVAALRKTLPLPAGGAAWSPRGCSLPTTPPLTAACERMTGLKLEAMLLKRLYLSGCAVDKERFRDLQAAGEAAIGTGELSGTTALVETMRHLMPWKEWRQQRRENYRVLAEAVKDLPSLSILQPDPSADTCPFGLVLVFDNSAKREKVRRQLIAQSVYPTVLWPMPINGAPDSCPSAVDLAQRLLVVPCDHRYRGPTITRTAAVLRDAVTQ